MSLLIGIDVGGTNTDSVLLDPTKSKESNRGVLAWNKSNTTSDVSNGIESAIKSLFEQVPNVKKEEILAVTIGTTHFINAVIEKDKARLDKVAVLRLCGPYSRTTPPFADFPSGLKSILNGYIGFLDGGHYVHGDEVQPINEAEVLEHCQKIKELRLKSVVLVGQFSPMVNDHEDEVEKIIAKALPDISIVKSYEISGLGFLERENAAILNAAILRFAKKVIISFNAAVQRIGLTCPVLLTQNDGTILSSHIARRIPISTFSSGATNSMRGASFLCAGEDELKDTSVIVVDVGGTTTDVGILLHTGFPRQAASHSLVGGVRMNFSMPHVESIGLGGGSIVRISNEEVSVGPDSVGNEILKRSIICGGDTVTATDVTIAFNGSIYDDVKIGNFNLVDKTFDHSIMENFTKEVTHKLEKVIDRMRTSPDPLPVLLVGGGSFIVPNALEGASKVLRPPFYNVANAIGAAMSKISGSVHTIKLLPPDSMSKEDFLEKCIEEARSQAIQRGALKSSITVVELSHDPVPYVPNTYEFHVKVVGDVDFSKLQKAFNFDDATKSTIVESGGEVLKDVTEAAEDFSIENIDINQYKPTVNDKREWIINEIDLEFLRIGTYILGCGGGGTPYPSFLDIRHLVRQGEILKVIDIKDIKNYIKDEGSIIPVGFAGSPTVAIEQLKSEELVHAARSLSKFIGKTPELVYPLEIGGGNGFTAFEIAATSRLNIPVVDCDLMGRAYPTLWQTTANACLENFKYSPAVISNGNGNTMIISETASSVILEKVVRVSLTELGTHVGKVSSPMTEAQIIAGTVHKSISLAWRIGKAVALAKQELDIENLPSRIIDSVGGPQVGKYLFTGKIIDVSRKLYKGHVYGEVVIEEDSPSKRQMVIPFKNENIYCSIRQDKNDSGEIVCSVPDLITVNEVDTGEAVGTPDYKYGLMVFVLGISPSDKWTSTQKALDIGGTKAFGFNDVEYKPVGKYVEPVSVIDEYHLS
ncbi:uncharacterized protein RJT21DRAFT_118560 [Scheffersomyces amazonensis]|uniref:uncharacterized protein n=1 Tax=Scheffersomyces amazonensis TaxID=1078765 RepID=UPI00315D0F7E